MDKNTQGLVVRRSVSKWKWSGDKSAEGQAPTLDSSAVEEKDDIV